MGGRPPRADDLSGLFSGRRIDIRSGVNDEQNHMSGQANRLPAVPVRVRVRTADSEMGSPNTSRAVSKLRPWSRLLVRFFSFRHVQRTLFPYVYVTTVL